MLNVGQLNEGFVLDHIEAGKSMMIYNNLGLGEPTVRLLLSRMQEAVKWEERILSRLRADLTLLI